MTFIYALIDPRTGQVRYVGKANDVPRRFTEHLRAARNGYGSYCARWIRGVLAAGQEPVVTVLERVALAEWEKAEQRWIAIMRSAGHPLTNTGDGGHGSLSLEHRAKIGAAMKVRPVTWGGKISAALRGEKNPNYGKKRSPEARATTSAKLKGRVSPMKGRVHSAASREKMRKAQQARREHERANR